MVLRVGFINAPALCQRLTNLVLARLNWEGCLVYLDDVIVLADTVERNVERIKLVMVRQQKSTINIESCKLQAKQNISRTHRKWKRNRTRP